jgi:hypothetical protein
VPVAPSSTVPAVKAYLFNALKVRTELATLIAQGEALVSYDDPGPFQPQDIVAVTNVTRSVKPLQMVGGGGAGWLDESYTVDVVVDVFRGGDDPQTVFERACLLVDVVVDVVRQDPSLGGLVIQANPEASDYVSEWATQDQEDTEQVLYLGRATRVLVPIKVYARI